MPNAAGSGKDAGKTEAPDNPSVEQYLVKDPERFALNIARMIEQAGKAASAWAEPREKGERSDHVAEPAADMVRTFSKLTEYWLSDPSRALEAQTRLFSGYMQVWANAIERVSGAAEIEDVVKPEKGDKRFLDP
ncbi:MAG: class I poly(R)-hydroxyalkanoic acid synthase, partial [Mesorhizobium sp.]